MVGDVRIFEITLDRANPKTGPAELLCDLPDATRKHYGRLITTHANPKAASKAATATFNNWMERLNG